MSNEDERVISDCRKMPSEKNCSVTIAGRRKEVVPLATHHVVHDHGHPDNDETREMVEKDMLVVQQSELPSDSV